MAAGNDNHASKTQELVVCILSTTLLSQNKKGELIFSLSFFCFVLILILFAYLDSWRVVSTWQGGSCPNLPAQISSPLQKPFASERQPWKADGVSKRNIFVPSLTTRVCPIQQQSFELPSLLKVVALWKLNKYMLRYSRKRVRTKAVLPDQCIWIKWA